jgi:hypothetical protein
MENNKHDKVKLHTFEYGCHPILAQQHQIFKIPPNYWG